MTQYAQIADSPLRKRRPLEADEARLRRSWVKVREGTVAEHQECGWYEVLDTARPDDTDTTTHDRSVDLLARLVRGDFDHLDGSRRL